MLTGSGAIRNLSLQEPSDVIKENVVRSNFDYFFKRSGHSLVVFGPVTKEQRARSQPYFNRTGSLTVATGPSCIRCASSITRSLRCSARRLTMLST
jgi:hypothetical protein